MKSRYQLCCMATLWMLAAAVAPVQAEVVYTQVNVVIPAAGSYPIDLNHDGIVDFTLQSVVGEVWCQAGDGGYWKLSVESSPNNGVVVTAGQDAAALLIGVPVSSGQGFAGGTTLLTEFGFGYCGQFVLGDWLNVPNRYLGVRFEITANGVVETHYGWVKLSDVAYIDRLGNLYATTLVSGFAYESVPGQPIVTGQSSGLHEEMPLVCNSGEGRQCPP